MIIFYKDEIIEDNDSNRYDFFKYFYILNE